jgi:hypothetical protein
MSTPLSKIEHIVASINHIYVAAFKPIGIFIVLIDRYRKPPLLK